MTVAVFGLGDIVADVVDLACRDGGEVGASFLTGGGCAGELAVGRYAAVAGLRGIQGADVVGADVGSRWVWPRIGVDPDARAAPRAQYVSMSFWGGAGMSIYTDRREVGLVLADRLRDEHLEGGVVVGLARCGVVVAAEAARRLGLSLDALAVRKVGRPLQPQYWVGAVTPAPTRCIARGTWS